MRHVIRFLNAVARDIERAEKERVREEKRRQKIIQKKQNALIQMRKNKAKQSGYCFESDVISKQNNNLRIEGMLKDYIFWQYFAIDYDMADLSEELKEKIKEITCEGTNWKAEWRMS